MKKPAVWAEADVASLAAALAASRAALRESSRPSVCTTGSALGTVKRISRSCAQRAATNAASKI